jgi:hypothetical protein
MRLAVSVALLAGAVAPAGARAATPTVDVLVVGRGGKVLDGPALRRAVDGHVRSDGRTCAVPGGTALAALLATGVPVTATSGGQCEPTAYYVKSVGRQTARGQEGWVYKVGHRAGTAAAGDPSGPFGDRRPLRARQRVTWFWCKLAASGGCQRTLEVRRNGRLLRVTGYDDQGRGVRIRGVRVRLAGGKVLGRTNRRGELRAKLPAGARVTAAKSGLVPWAGTL